MVKVVMRLTISDAKKRAKALKTAGGFPGVVSVSLYRDRLTVVGEGIDSVALAVVLRNKMRVPVELLSVGDYLMDDEIAWSPAPSPSPVNYNYAYQAPVQPYYHPYPYEVHSADRENCSIM